MAMTKLTVEIHLYSYSFYQSLSLTHSVFFLLVVIHSLSLSFQMLVTLFLYDSVNNNFNLLLF